MCWGIHPSPSLHHSSWVPGKLSVKSNFSQPYISAEHLCRLPRILHKPGLDFMGKQANWQFCSNCIQEGDQCPSEPRNQCQNRGTKPTVVIWAKASIQEWSKLSQRHQLHQVNITDKTMGYWGCSWLEDLLNNPWSDPEGHILDSSVMLMGRI